MNITVILCTHNRCQSLAKALASAAALRVPESLEWEVLVVDNNSRDQTREVVKEFADQYPGRFRYLFEPQPGKSYALNTGIREARGTVLAFIDDDVSVEPYWLMNLTAALHSGESAGAGGRILPEKNFSPPGWLSLTGPRGRYALAPLALFDLGEQPGALAEPPFGTNMAFRKEMFEKHGYFRTDLGPRPGSEIRNEDTEFGARLLAQGERIRYEPSAVVYHTVSEDRVQKKYYLDWWFDKGRADIRQFGIPTNAWCVLGIPLYLFRRLAVWTLRWMVTFDPPRRFHSKLAVWAKAGEILECYRHTPAEMRARNVQN
jgi:glycosyltransferase involved in cell wall biosynthesis